MAALKVAFEKLALKNVKTILASGNVKFESDRTDQRRLVDNIEAALAGLIGREVCVVLRELDAMRRIVASEPFKGIKVTPSIRLYVTFLKQKPGPRAKHSPYISTDGSFRILHIAEREVFSVLDVSKGKGTGDSMGVLEKEFGSDVTTRNLNTVLKTLR
jgi:uncharacterized protein (DUF1697 family)